MNGVAYRLNDFLGPKDGRSLVVDASAGLALGPLPGLEDFSAGVKPVLRLVDGVVCSPGQLRRLGGRGKGEAGLLVRVDWTNTLRGKDFVLPPVQARRLPILSAQDALDLGAVGMVSTFLLGYEEEIEAGCLRSTVLTALEGKEIGMPLVVEVRTDGPRVSLPGKAVELGASYALEGGADVVVVPYPGRASLETIAAFTSVPWLVKPGDLASAQAALEETLALGGAGLWLDGQVFAQADPAGFLAPLYERLHASLAAETA